MIYLKDMGYSFKEIDRAKQIELYRKMKNGDENARTDLINSCLPLVVSIASKKKKLNSWIPEEDLIQEGNIALINAVDKWDGEKTNITTVATVYINNWLIDYCKSQFYLNNVFNISKYIWGQIIKVKNLNTKDIDEIKRLTNFKIKKIKLILSFIDADICPLGRPGHSVFWKNNRNENYESISSLIKDPGVKDNKCLADLFKIVEEQIPAGQDKDIFIDYISNISDKTTIKKVCENFNLDRRYVIKSINKTKNIIKNLGSCYA